MPKKDGVYKHLESIIKSLEEKHNKLEEEIDQLTRLNSQIATKNQELVRNLQERSEELLETTVLLEKFKERLLRLMSPPFLFANFIEFIGDKLADVLYDGRRKRVAIDPELNRKLLKPGMTVVILSDSNAIVDTGRSLAESGNVVTLDSYFGSDTAIVYDDRGKEVVYLNEGFDREQAPPKSKVLVAGGFIHKVVESAKKATNEYLLAEVPDVGFDDIGGLDTQLELIQKEIEDSFSVPELYDLYQIPKETHILLYGLPGNGKTMIAKAIANTLLDKFKERIAAHAPGNFFTVRGPELENKWVGETERMLREVFDAAAELAKKANAPVFIFFDDCEAFLLRRGAGISSDVNMGHVTQFATLLDGIKEIKGVNVILATNRLDLIDPAVVRRVSWTVRIPEPNREGATKILHKLLRKVPLRKEVVLPDVVEKVIDKMYEDTTGNDFVEVIFADDTTQIIKISDLLSGKIISDIVNRAKKLAKDYDKTLLKEEWPTGVSAENIIEAVRIEFKSNEGLPSTKDTIAEWLRQKGITKEVVETRKIFGEVIGKHRPRADVQ